MPELERETRTVAWGRVLLVAYVLLSPALPAGGQVIEGVLLENGSDRVVRFGSVALLHEDRSVAVASAMQAISTTAASMDKRIVGKSISG